MIYNWIFNDKIGNDKKLQKITQSYYNGIFMY